MNRIYKLEYIFKLLYVYLPFMISSCRTFFFPLSYCMYQLSNLVDTPEVVLLFCENCLQAFWRGISILMEGGNRKQGTLGCTLPYAVKPFFTSLMSFSIF